MTECNTSNSLFQAELFPKIQGRKIKVNFDGGNVSSDGGVLLLKQVDRNLKLTTRLASICKKYDTRQEGKIEHDVRTMLIQRIYAIACGYEDLNDHNDLRRDIAWQTVAEKTKELASTSTLCRFENTSIRAMCMELMNYMIDLFIESFKRSPEEIILDFDNTNNTIHGKQEGRFFHGYYDEYCFLPLYVYSGEKLVTAFLQPSDEDGAKHAGAVLKIISEKLRKKWPDVKIIYRGDSGFARKRHLHWCEKNNIDYIIGFSKNNRLEDELSDVMKEAEDLYQKTGEKVKLYKKFRYAAGSWNGRNRNVIGKAEFSQYGKNPRFILTTLDGAPKQLYEDVYCFRGEMENRLKEQKLGLFSDRTSAHKWWTNQFRILLAAFAYILFEEMRNTALKDTVLEKAQVGTIRLKLLKIGAVITRNTRTIMFRLSSACTCKNIFWKVAEAFAPG